jgi:hypothetical protein
MRAATVSLVAIALAAVTAGCGEPPEASVEQAFRGYHAALLKRDFHTACSYNSPEATARLLQTVRLQDIDARSCEDAFAAIYAEDGPAAAADGIGTSLQIQHVTVTGDDAAIQWSAQIEGEQHPAKAMMHRTDGRWLLMVQ